MYIRSVFASIEASSRGGLMTKNRFHALLRTESEANTKFSYIDPPFNFNHPNIAQYPPEVTGCHLLQSLCRRIGWTSFKGKRLLDFGCGVRFVRTIVNLGMDIGLYVGVDVDEKAIAWLQGKCRRRPIPIRIFGHV
jgi:hypothetical protein